MANFNGKSFNPQAFGQYIDNLPSLSKREIAKSGVFKRNSEIKRAFSSQGGTAYAILPMYGKIDGEAVNYDGTTDIVSNATKTYERGVVVIGRANAWLEEDFAEDITGGVGFMSNVAMQVDEYFEGIDQKLLLSILKGIFSMTGGDHAKFVTEHTLDISAGTQVAADEEAVGVSIEPGSDKVAASTFNTAMQRACGQNKQAFSLIIMHSVVATNLENLNLLNYLKYSDSNGMQRDIGLATVNGKLVVISDDGTFNGTDKYTSYILGKGCFDVEDVGAKIPYEMGRDPKTNGGQTTLYVRRRKCIAPYGISYVKANQTSLSPTNSELENGSNWKLVSSADNSKTIDHKTIPIARVISKG